MAEIKFDELKIENLSEKKVVNEIHEYEDYSIKTEGQKTIRNILYAVFCICGLFIVALLLNISDKIKNFNSTAGYISLVAFAILFVVFYIRPIFIFLQMKHFETDINAKNSQFVISHNINVRKDIAKRIIEFCSNIPDSNWYDINYVKKLKVAYDNNDDKGINSYLLALMNDSIKKTSDRIIVNASVQSGIFAAVSQSPHLDALLVFSVNFKMIKDLIFLYGFRPTEAKLLKIVFKVLISSLAAYQIDGAKIGTFISSRLASKSIPIIKEATAFITDAVIQAITNGTLTMWIGYKTINYLVEEYKLPLLFENIDILDDKNEFDCTRKEVLDKITEKVPFIKEQLNKLDKDNHSNVNDGKQDINEIIVPYSSSRFIGKPFVEVQKDLLQIGIPVERINLISVPKAHKGFFKKDGEVVEVVIDGNNNFNPGTRLHKDSNVDIKYLTYLN